MHGKQRSAGHLGRAGAGEGVRELADAGGVEELQEAVLLDRALHVLRVQQHLPYLQHLHRIVAPALRIGAWTFVIGEGLPAQQPSC